MDYEVVQKLAELMSGTDLNTLVEELDKIMNDPGYANVQDEGSRDLNSP